ncbi:unnamed protein product [Rotaria sp. Silwood1]|nr:unnamed protein product [Rotaria sp. Silwood1]CAF1189825.1 unnamed protein product [Rotaria sp. Silwood1]CAF3481471.1 unnamed protein product [Rotaria sp. Silwood1]CAF3498448.1 unnamed protein product [Rotaria sp. Silwood1]
MGTKSFRSHFILLFCLINLKNYINADQYKIILNSLFTQSSYPSINFALKQIASLQMDIIFELNTTKDIIIPCDVGTCVKILFNIINRTNLSNVLISDACQNVLSYIAEAATYFHIPVFSFTESDLSLSSIDRYPFFYHIVPSDRDHNVVRKQLLQYFNWTRFGLIYQHGSKYTLVANDLSNLTAIDKKQWEVNLTRGIAYRHGLEWHGDNAKNMKGLLKDFKAKDVRIIIANFNQTIATHMFCHAAKEHVYGSRYQWIILGYPSLLAWWNEQTDCSLQELVRAINGTLQTRIPQLSIYDVNDQPSYVLDYLEQFSKFERNYFDAYAYDTIWSLAYLYQSKFLFNQTNIRTIVDNIDFNGATGRVRYLNGRRVGEILVEQYVACRMMNDGSCKTPCYEKDKDCNLTIVKVFLAKTSDSKSDPPNLYEINPIIWHGNGPPKDRTNQTIVFEHIYLSVFISITICSGIGLIISISLFVFNIHFRKHRYIRMSSPALNNIILGGCILAYISMILLGINSSLFPQGIFTETIMNIICATRVWFLCISFTLAFGSMFSKTWRVHSIFTNINITKKGIHDSRLLFVVGALLCIDLFFLIAWQIFDPIHRQIVYDIPYLPKYNQDIEILPYREECKGHHTTFWFLVLISYKGLLMSYGSFLSWTTRHVTIPALNDSRYIGLSVYIVFICCTLGSLVVFIPSEQIQFSYCLISFFIVICTTVTVCLVFVPKIVEVYHDPYSKKKQMRITGRLHSNSSRKTILTFKHLNDAAIDNQQLRLVLSLQEQTLDRLVKEINDCSMEKRSVEEPFELERLMVPDNEIEDEIEEIPTINEEEEEDEDDNYYRIIPNNNQDLKGRVARAVSLCLYNKLHMTQLYWPDKVGTTRYSLSQLERYQPSPSKKLFRTPSQKSIGFSQIQESHEQTSNLLTTSSTRDLESLYDGLIGLDEIRLNKMIETDLISSYY